MKMIQLILGMMTMVMGMLLLPRKMGMALYAAGFLAIMTSL